MINLKVAMICFKVSVPFRYLTKKLMGNGGPNIWPLSRLRNDAVKARIVNSERCAEMFRIREALVPEGNVVFPC